MLKKKGLTVADYQRGVAKRSSRRFFKGKKKKMVCKKHGKMNCKTC